MPRRTCSCRNDRGESRCMAVSPTGWSVRRSSTTSTIATRSSSLIDYPTPRAGDLPSFDISFIETPAPDNPFLVEGGSERDDRRAAANRHCGYRCFMAPAPAISRLPSLRKRCAARYQRRQR